MIHSYYKLSLPVEQAVQLTAVIPANINKSKFGVFFILPTSFFFCQFPFKFSIAHVKIALLPF